jgi:hypothetical protein
MDIKKIKPENLDGIHTDQDRVQREALLNMVMKCMYGSIKARNFLTT